ncbi:hypothetical protein Anapl_07645 [Anas platyrhynchos]|uniref:Uncharacterized protein n=1 Tax=Anas platyrhynchos TaxID=8839 RepID=R0LZQ2_ANAPL|nr:hypothetical protein Anapl_07645 [Anas platyrhynchos]
MVKVPKKLFCALMVLKRQLLTRTGAQAAGDFHCQGSGSNHTKCCELLTAEDEQLRQKEKSSGLTNGGEWSYLHPIHLCALGETRPGQVDTGLSNSHSPQKGDLAETDGSVSGKQQNPGCFSSFGGHTTPQSLPVLFHPKPYVNQGSVATPSYRSYRAPETQYRELSFLWQPCLQSAHDPLRSQLLPSTYQAPTAIEVNVCCGCVERLVQVQPKLVRYGQDQLPELDGKQQGASSSGGMCCLQDELPDNELAAEFE